MFALAVAALALTEAPAVVELSPRSAVLVHVISPDPTVDKAHVRGVVDRAVRPRARLAVPADGLGVPLPDLIRCEDGDSLLCWAMVARPDHRDLLAGAGPKSYASHLEALLARGTPYARLVVVLSLFPIAKRPHRVNVLLLDTDGALAALAHAPAGTKPATLEAEIFTRDARTHSGEVDLEAEGALAQFLADFWDLQRAWLDGRGLWMPSGELRIAGRGLDVEISGRRLEVSGDELVLSGLGAGLHRVKVEDPSGLRRPFDREVEVRVGERTPIELELSPVAEVAPTVRAATFYGGLALAAVGAALSVYAVVAEPELVDLVPCPGGQCPAGGRSFLSFQDVTATDPNREPGGVLIAPLGYSLVLAGASFSLGSSVLGEEHDLPIWAWAAGVVLGAGAYGLSAALNGQ